MNITYLLTSLAGGWGTSCQSHYRQHRLYTYSCWTT